MTMVRWVTLMALVSLASVSHAAGADQASPPEAETDLERAKHLYERASRALEAKRLDEALELFRESKALVPSRYSAQGEAYCLYALGRNAEALSAHEALSSDYAAELDADKRRALAERISELKTKVATLSVTSSAGGSVQVDGRKIGEAPLSAPIYLEPGSHVVVVTRAGYQEFRRAVALGAGQSLLIDASLVPVTKPARRSDAMRPKRRTNPPPVPRDRADDAQATIGWVVGGAGLVALGVGVYFGLRAIDKKNESDDALDDDGRCFRPCHDAWEEGHSAATVANVATGIGVVALGVGLYLLLSAEGEANATASFDGPAIRW